MKKIKKAAKNIAKGAGIASRLVVQTAVPATRAVTRKDVKAIKKGTKKLGRAVKAVSTGGSYSSYKRKK